MKLGLFIFAAFISNAFADQCQWNSKTDAESALKLVKGNDIITWCQNCGDAKPSYIAKVISAKQVTVSSKFSPGTYREITVETAKGKETIDLAYTYARTATNVFTNIAQLVGCPSTGATTFIQTGPGVKKTAHYYNQLGERVDVTSSTSEEAMLSTGRFPASKK